MRNQSYESCVSDVDISSHKFLNFVILLFSDGMGNYQEKRMPIAVYKRFTDEGSVKYLHLHNAHKQHVICVVCCTCEYRVHNGVNFSENDVFITSLVFIRMLRDYGIYVI